MKRRGGVRWQLWAAGFAAFAMGAGAATGCDDESTTQQTTAATGTGTGTSTGSGTTTGTGTGSTGTTTTTDDGCGGAAACQQLCDDAQAKLAACFADAGIGQGGGGGAGGGEQFLCNEEGQCVSECVLQYSCQEIVFNGNNYSACYGCCKDPYLC